MNLINDSNEHWSSVSFSAHRCFTFNFARLSRYWKNCISGIIDSVLLLLYTVADDCTLPCCFSDRLSTMFMPTYIANPHHNHPYHHHRRCLSPPPPSLPPFTRRSTLYSLHPNSIHKIDIACPRPTIFHWSFLIIHMSMFWFDSSGPGFSFDRTRCHQTIAVVEGGAVIEKRSGEDYQSVFLNPPIPQDER